MKEYREKNVGYPKYPKNIGPSKGYIITGEFYADKIKEGYRFQTNTHSTNKLYPENAADELVKRYKEQGFDVFVGDKAFDFNGKEISWLVAIFVKPKSLESKASN